ncbi:tetratricopeptide repeat protein [cf. Phormidesmis sp. LEGE 11477]|uniref:tetratricopeptide repeat protein n=1 Tax=cf. Phormidesmis sp. LEGE 11477 TaxID=1828680 RepID=UPI00187FED0F|nr:tetratricopeptide repeat protein [cf. Phormidesmis sp. LEGE 11477]
MPLGDAVAYYNLGYPYHLQERLSEAIGLYKQALDIDADFVIAQDKLQEAERLLTSRSGSTSTSE